MVAGNLLRWFSLRPPAIFPETHNISRAHSSSVVDEGGGGSSTNDGG
jgi:hypothetical protein